MKITNDQVYDDLLASILAAEMCRELWWEMTRDRSDDDPAIGLFTYYEGMFETIRIATYISFLAKLTTAFDDDDRSVSLRLLYNRIRMAPVDSAPALTEIESDLESLWLDGRKLYTYRNKNIAHRSLAQFRRDFAAETGFQLDDLERMATSAMGLLRKMGRHLGKEDRIIPLGQRDDLNHLVEDLLTGLPHKPYETTNKAEHTER